ncbi:MAG: hypothetical protein GX542_13075 [Rhodococcus sp.]|nr:hypothetical protein [Rhodococcus sp. (in: high G+C Gram-positive bacteria)]
MKRDFQASVHLDVKQRDTFPGDEQFTSDLASPHLLEVAEPLPARCAKHGEPAARSKQLSALTPSVFTGLKLFISPFKLADEIRNPHLTFNALVDWPQCSRCIAQQRWWRVVAGLLAALALVCVGVCVWVLNSGNQDAYMAWFSLSFFAFLPTTLAATKVFKLSSTGLRGPIVARDGSAVILRSADAKFVEVLEQLRCENSADRGSC